MTSGALPATLDLSQADQMTNGGGRLGLVLQLTPTWQVVQKIRPFTGRRKMHNDC